MFPFIDVKPFEIGFLEIHLFGILVATGVVIGSSLAARYAERNAIDPDYLRWIGFRLVVGGFIICHLIDVLFYQQDKLAKEPWILLYVWQGISSYGGFIGGFIMFMWYTQARYKPPISRLELGDNAIYAFAPGFWFGRMGCSVAHDHPGVPTDFPLAVEFPPHRYPAAEVYGLDASQPISAHDLGLYEALYLMPLIVLGVVLISRWKGRKPGMMLAYACVLYSIPRFFLEFLRIESTDPRYWGMTPAQWFSIILLGAGLYLVFYAIPRQKQTTLELAQFRIERGDAEPPPGAKARPSQPKKKGGGSGKKKKSGGKKKK